MCTLAYCFFVVSSGTFRFMLSAEFFASDRMMRKSWKQTQFIVHDLLQRSYTFESLTYRDKVSTQF